MSSPNPEHDILEKAFGAPDPFSSSMGATRVVRDGRVFAYMPGGGEDFNFIAAAAGACPLGVVTAGCDYFGARNERFSIALGVARARMPRVPGWTVASRQAVYVRQLTAPTKAPAKNRSALHLEEVRCAASLERWMRIVRTAFPRTGETRVDDSRLLGTQDADRWRLYLARDGDGLVGAAGLYSTGRAAVLSDFCIARKSRGRGYGRRFLDLLGGEVPALGSCCLVAMSLPRARAFYERAGFTSAMRVARLRCSARLALF